jgi:hypothetical protein
MSISFGPGITIGPNISLNLPVPFKRSFYFDGSSNIIGPTNITGLRMTSGTNFTCEFWINASDVTTSYQGIVEYVNPTLTAGWVLSIGGPFGANAINFFQRNNGASTQGIASSTLTANTWYHVALVYNSTNCRLFLNGVSQGTCNLNQLSNTGQQLFIGKYSDASFVNNAYISNLRVVSGYALYTGNFTPPAEPLSSITGTVILTCNSDSLVDTSPNAYSLTYYGNGIGISSFSPF